MPRDLRMYLWDIEHSGSKITAFTRGQTFFDYRQDDMRRAAVERMFEIIGEALSQISIHHPAAFQQLTMAREYVNFRNVLIHRYSNVDDGVVWTAIESDLHLLLAQVSDMRNRLDKAANDL